MGFRRWKLPQADPDRVKNLIDQTGMPPIAAQILEGRGVSEPEQAKAYAGFDREAKMHDPFLMADMRQAVERLARAVEEGEQIAVYGDYDCDGITATAMLYTYLEDLGARVIYYIPDRDQEGYGLNRGALDFLKEQQVDLVVTVDNGISALDEAEYAASIGLDLVITDHPSAASTAAQRPAQWSTRTGRIALTRLVPVWRRGGLQADLRDGGGSFRGGDDLAFWRAGGHRDGGGHR